jgi:GntR family transcriptional regulator/MocR family aminotransferase
MRKLYAERRELMMSGLQTHLSQWLEPIPASGGMHLTALAKEELDYDAIARTARQRNIDVRSLRTMSANGNGQMGLVFGYGATAPEAMIGGFLQLRRIFPASGTAKYVRGGSRSAVAPR